MTSSWGSTWGAAASSWLLGGERGTGECVFLVCPQAEQPLAFTLFSCPSLCNDRCRGGAELESLFMRQSTVAFERISCISCSHCSHLEIWRIISSWLRIWQSHVLCLRVACGILKNEFSGDSAVIRAQRLAVRGAFGRIAHNFYVGVDSNPEVFFYSFLRRTEKCAQSMPEVR